MGGAGAVKTGVPIGADKAGAPITLTPLIGSWACTVCCRSILSKTSMQLPLALKSTVRQSHFFISNSLACSETSSLEISRASAVSAGRCICEHGAGAAAGAACCTRSIYSLRLAAMLGGDAGWVLPRSALHWRLVLACGSTDWLLCDRDTFPLLTETSSALSSLGKAGSGGVGLGRPLLSLSAPGAGCCCSCSCGRWPCGKKVK